MPTHTSALPVPTLESKGRSFPQPWLRRGLLGAGLLALTAAIAGSWTGFGRRPHGERRKRMERSPQWRDGKFRNPQPIWNDMAKAIASALKSNPNAAPNQPVPVKRVDAALFNTPPASGLRVTWLGHSTTLVEIDGVRILTDPVWSERASPVTWAGVRRWFVPPLALTDLPAVDAVVISHDHYDHLDHTTIIALKDRPTKFIVPLGVGAHLEYWGVPAERIVELDWWDHTAINSVAITSTPARHSSARGLFDRDLTLWSGYAFTGPQHRVYFSGDTGMQSAFTEIAERLGPFDATMIEIGEYNANWPDWHSGPEQAVAAHRMVNGALMIPIHWGTFKLAPHTWTEPAERAVAEAIRTGVTIATPLPGESVEPAGTIPSSRWWPELPFSTAEETPIISTTDGSAPAAQSLSSSL